MKPRRCRREILFKQSGQGIVLTCDLPTKHQGWHQLVLEKYGKPGTGVGYLLWSVKRGNPFVSDPLPKTRHKVTKGAG